MPDPKLSFPKDLEAAEEQIVEQSKRIEFYITEFSIELLAIKMDKGDFFIPEYQREFTWEHERKSRFIESVIMGLPIPFLFFWEAENGQLEVVDGSQRLRTLHEFIYEELELGDLDILWRLSGTKFEDLSPSRRMKIGNRPIRGIVLNEHADAQARFEMFDRINTGSKAANPMEIRRGALAGPFMQLVIELSKDKLFEALAPVPSKTLKERGRDELVTRFFAYGDGLDGYQDRPSEFLYKYTEKMNQEFAEDEGLADIYRKRFHDTMHFVSDRFPHGFRRTKKGTATPRVRFEAISIGSFRAILERPDIVDSAVEIRQVSDWIDGDDFRKVIGADGANAVARLEGRIRFVKDHLLS